MHFCEIGRINSLQDILEGDPAFRTVSGLFSKIAAALGSFLGSGGKARIAESARAFRP